MNSDDRNENAQQGNHDPVSPAQSEASASAASPGPSSMPRRALLLGSVATASAFSIRPAFAQGAVSMLNCEIPVPGPGSGNYIDAEGNEVPPMTTGAFPPAPRPFTGEDVKNALNGRSLPGTSPSQSDAYLNYIRKLQIGDSGYTCFVSLQRPR